MKKKYLGVSKDDKYVFTSKGFYICEGKGEFVPFNSNVTPYLIEMSKDNSNYEFLTGEISLKEYVNRPAKILNILSESLSIRKSLKVIKEWERKYGSKNILTESSNKKSVFSYVNESFDELSKIFIEKKKFILEQSEVSTSKDIADKLIDALSHPFDDNEIEALKQIKRINSKDLLSSVSREIYLKKRMSLINYLNDEMSDADIEYRQIFNHLKNFDSSSASGYKENKFYRAVGVATDVGGTVLKGLSAAAKAIIMPIIKKGVIPLLRWIRRYLTSYLGIITDVVLSVLPTVAVMRVIWILICFLDLYEIVTGDYDPDDPDRKDMPFVFLFGDVLSFFFSGAAGAIGRTAIKTSIKSGVKNSTKTIGYIKKIISGVPTIKNFLLQAKNFLTKLFGEKISGFISGLFDLVDKGLTKFIDWIKGIMDKTLSALKTKSGLVTAGINLGIGVGLAEFLADKSFGEGKSGIYGKGEEVRAIQNGLLNFSNNPDLPELKNAYTKTPNGIYDKETGDAIYKVYQVLKMTPKREATPYIASLIGGVQHDGGLFKIIPDRVKQSLGEKIMAANDYISNLAVKMGAKGIKYQSN